MATCSAAINTESFLHPLQRLQKCSLCLPKQRVGLGRVGAGVLAGHLAAHATGRLNVSGTVEAPLQGFARGVALWKEQLESQFL